MRLPKKNNHSASRGVAAVELAFVLPFLVILLLGVWEVGRMIEVQQILNNAAREGSRLAAQGLIINQDSNPTLIKVTTGSPNVESAVRNYLREAGINTANMTVTFQYVDGNTSNTEPFQASKGQRFKVTVSIPFDNVKWTLLRFTSFSNLSSTVEAESLVDEAFTINTTIPQW